MKLDGRVALVTGGASGIGRASALRFAAAGMRVCVVDIDGEAAQAVADSIDGVGLSCDVSDPAQVEAAFTRCVEELGGLDLAFLNAGITIHWSGDIGSLDLDQYRRSVSVNLDGVVYGAVTAVRTMRSCAGSGERAILATASLAGLVPWHPDPVYSLGKHGVVGFMRSIAPNLAPEGISVHTICPGITETGVLGDRRKIVERIGVPVMEPEAIADAVLTAVTAPAEQTGTCWVAQHGKPAWPMTFADVAGPDMRLNVPVARQHN
ncbi:SDR family oxidoreductase [Mycolicibacterium diernhoferi]|uniref:Oxidoreductase n=2 Tax=Mycolicibacterium diernhoferi TaxID=1801 RepID=A0A1Q4HFT9_9MYCO|nr:SDR family oxidoreductase [Mycolicibacterium diernhoferi]OJZ66414.1 oxidoreductase [Mycolicibacterium diernhoferi]PEG54213.1 oxidoreductase [Mycolicibacterium diernhoferi]QYL24586.1 SDR family oxidoreductase [Mycolicibacterium diernhoferi]